ncbi:hypothetical protein [Pseudonocardia sp.]
MADPRRVPVLDLSRGATLWLRHFDRGPLEIVLHRLYRPAPVAAAG